MAECCELQDVIENGPIVPTRLVKVGDVTTQFPKSKKELDNANRKKIENNYKENKILMCDIRPNEYNKISASQTTNEIWDSLQIAHEGTIQVK